MVSVRVSLLLLCVAIAAHSVSACYTVSKGNLIDGNHTEFPVTMWPRVKDIEVNLYPSYEVADVIGLKVVICELGLPTNVSDAVLSYAANDLTIKRTDSRDTIFTFDITVYTSDAVFGRSQALPEGVL